MRRWGPFIGLFLLGLPHGNCRAEALSVANHRKPVAVSVESALNRGNYISTKRVLLEAVKKPRPKGSAAAMEWNRALIALISLERLMGDDSEAKKQFSRCDSNCVKILSQQEWSSLRTWACVGKHMPKACTLRKK